MKMNSILGNTNKNPGPGNYHYNYSTLSDIKYSFTTGVRSDKNKLKDKELELIGPGKYKVVEGISKNGKYNNSKFKTYGIPIMNPLSNKSVSPDRQCIIIIILSLYYYSSNTKLFQKLFSYILLIIIL
jgi:uncharacterized membrane protein